MAVTMFLGGWEQLPNETVTFKWSVSYYICPSNEVYFTQAL